MIHKNFIIQNLFHYPFHVFLVSGAKEEHTLFLDGLYDDASSQ